MKNFLLTLLLAALASSVLCARSLSEIKSSGVIRVGVYDAQPPFGKLEDGVHRGFEVDMANEIAKDIFKNGGKVEFISTAANQRIRYLQEDKVDMVIATITVTPEREKQIDFTTPYFSVNIGVLIRVEDKIRSLGDLKDQTILVLNGGTSEPYFEKQGYKTVKCESASACYKALKAGQGAAYADDNLVVLAYPVLDKKVEVNIKNLGTSDFLAIGVQKGNSELLDFLNEELIKLSKEGFFKKIFNESIEPYYKGTAERKYFLLDDLYSLL